MLRKVKDLGAKELDDRGKMDLKDLLMFSRKREDPGNLGTVGGNAKRMRIPRGPVEGVVKDKHVPGDIYFLNFAQGRAM